MAVPYFADQPFWGRRLAELGIGAPPLPRSELGAVALSERIDLFGQDLLRARAGRIGSAIREERGLERAADFIVTHLDRS
jgi:UDP:flavonoid glycosyltransferase YjiC (YdhE family)